MRENTAVLMWRFRTPIDQTEMTSVEVVQEGLAGWRPYKSHEDAGDVSHELMSLGIPQADTNYVGQAVLV